MDIIFQMFDVNLTNFAVSPNPGFSLLYMSSWFTKYTCKSMPESCASMGSSNEQVSSHSGKQKVQL